MDEARQANRRLARVGIALGGITLAMLLGVGLLIPMHGSAGERHNRVKCSSNLRLIAMGLILYSNDHGGLYPPSLDLLLTHGDLNAECFCCPSSDAEKANGPTTQQVVAKFVQYPNRHLSYIYLGNTITPNHSANHVLAYEHLSNHVNKGMNVLYNDGYTYWYDADTAEYITAELQAGRNPPRPMAGRYTPPYPSATQPAQ